MPRGSSAYKTAAGAPEITTAYLVAIPKLVAANDPSTSVELYFTTWPENIVYGGKTYWPSPLEITAPKISKDMERATGSVALCNLPGEFSQYAKNYIIQDAPITITHAVKSGDTWIGVSSFVGVMDAPTISEEKINVTIHNGRSVATLLPRQLYWTRDFPHLPSAKDPRSLSLK